MNRNLRRVNLAGRRDNLEQVYGRLIYNQLFIKRFSSYMKKKSPKPAAIIYFSRKRFLSR